MYGGVVIGHVTLLFYSSNNIGSNFIIVLFWLQGIVEFSSYISAFTLIF